MKIPSGSSFSAWRYVEMAAFRRWKDRETGETVEAVVREKDRSTDQIILYEWGDEVEKYRQQNNNVGIYTSVFRYNSRDMSEATRLGSLYFDFDSGEDEELDQAHKDTLKLYYHFRRWVPKDALRIYFTGSKGFHLEAEAITLGIDPSNRLANVFRFMANHLEEELGLSTLDFAVYDPRRMWRLPYSRHQKSDLYKVEILDDDTLSSLDAILRLASSNPEERSSFVPAFDHSANEWYKSWVVRYEEHQAEQERKSREKRRRLFDKYGTTLLKGHTEGYVDKVWRRALQGLREVDEGNRNVTLSRQAYKLYLTMMEANKPLDDVTNTLQETGVAIGLDEREVRATLKSAHRAAVKKYDEEPRSLYE